MIKEEIIGNFVRHYSDKNVKIQQEETGRLYDDAVDRIPCAFTYTETDIPIEDEVTAEEIKADLEAML